MKDNGSKDWKTTGDNVAKITAPEWDFVCFVDQFWRENNCFPSQEEIEEGLVISQTEIAFHFESEAVLKHITARGIDPTQTKDPNTTKAKSKRRGQLGRLTDIQLATASLVLNPSDRRSLKEKLDALGVSPATYNGWKKNKVFMDYLSKQGEQLFGENMPEVHNALTTRATQGDIRATKLLYEVTGRWRGVQQDNQGDVKMLLIALIEILQKHVKDPVVLQAIAADIQLAQISVQAGANQINQQQVGTTDPHYQQERSNSEYGNSGSGSSTSGKSEYGVFVKPASSFGSVKGELEIGS